MPRDQYYEAALAFAQEHGFEGNTLPHYGDHGSVSRSCPLARAIPGSVVGCESIELKVGRSTKVEQLPKEVARFVDLADNGRYVDMVGDPRPMS